jgi:large subunit ribosomal protein L33
LRNEIYSSLNFWQLGKVRREIMAKAKAKNIELIALKCSECNRKNYTTQKNKRNSQGKIEFRKYCKFDKKHTVHKETKIK